MPYFLEEIAGGTIFEVRRREIPKTYLSGSETHPDKTVPFSGDLLELHIRNKIKSWNFGK